MKSIARLSIVCLLVLCATAGTAAVTDEAKAKEDSTPGGAAAGQKQPQQTKAPEKPSSSKQSLHTVKRGPLVISVALDGVFEARNTHEIALRPKQWSSFRVLDAVEHGRRVKRGDSLVALDTEKIDRAIADLRAELQLSELAVKLAEQVLQSLEATTPLDLDAARRALRVTREDTQLYRTVNRPLSLKSAAFMLKSAQQSFEYQQEEVRQLEKMYKADDLTEETEEIVLRRARNSLERAKFYLEQAKIQHEQTLKLEIPRRDEQIEDSTKRSELQWQNNKVALPLALKKARLELKKMKVDRGRAEEKLKELQADRAAMVVKAPADGVIYYGKCSDGKFAGGGSLAENLRRDGNLSPKVVFMTLVEPRPMFVRAAVAEKDLQYVRAGLKGIAVPTGYPRIRLPARVDKLDPVPASSGSFGSQITVELDRKAKALTPGMTCKVKFIPYRKKRALTVPPKAVITDEWDDQKHYVYVLAASGKTKKQRVTVGKRTEKKVEILEGLSEGDQILLERPKAQ